MSLHWLVAAGLILNCCRGLSMTRNDIAALRGKYVGDTDRLVVDAASRCVALKATTVADIA